VTSPPNQPTDEDRAAEGRPTTTISLEALVALLQAENAMLRSRIAELERRLGLDSSNSGKPPSSDGLKKQPSRVRSLRERSGRKSGGQQGHRGETLRQVETPDEVVDHLPPTCGGCGASLAGSVSTDYAARQVFDLPEPPPLVVTEHRAHVCCCADCGTQTQGQFPEGVAAPVQYGARIGAIVVYLATAQFLPQDRLAAAMKDLFGLTIAAATIASMSRACAARLQGFVATLRDLVAAAPVKHMDETGFRIGGKTCWLHVATTALLTFYRTCAKRGSLLANVAGIVVHDHWKPYYTMQGVEHALCNAHHLRELKALVDIEKEAWARKMQTLLRRACHATDLARERGIGLTPRLIGRLRRRFEAILAEGLAFHEAQPAPGKDNARRRGRKARRTGHNLLLRLEQRKEDVLRFLYDPRVPFTNNQAERDVRMMKLRQKISGGFRSSDGAAEFADLRSVISTAQKQGWDILPVLMHGPTQPLRAT